jgi:hypothetical protein
MTEGLRALVLGAGHQGRGGLVHLVGRGDPRTLCGAYALENLVQPDGSDSEVCPACLEHLRAVWVRERGTEPRPQPFAV